jgi:Zn-dependent protease with chaperone function
MVPQQRVQFPGIRSQLFEHPMDRTALEALRRTPGLDRLLKKLAALHFERIVRIDMTGDSLRLSPRQCSSIYEIFRDACSTLDMPVPELFLKQNPQPNALAIGMERHTVVLTSSLVDMMTEDELRYVMAHELGHIKSGHMLYRTMAVFLTYIGLAAARKMPLIDLVTQAVVIAFYDWSRKSELTADRAGLLGVQNPDTAVRALLKLAGGGTRYTHELNIEEFLKQADDYEDLDTSILDAFYKLEITVHQTHPFPALRARELDNWSRSAEYRALLAGDYVREAGSASSRVCPRCGAIVDNPIHKFCADCGAEL